MSTKINVGGATFDNNGFTVENGVLIKYNGFESTVRVPEGVTAIGANAFSDAWAAGEVILPEGLEVICNSAFEDCLNITSVSLPDSLLSIGDRAFLGCTQLRLPTLPKGLVRIGREAFSGCALVEVTLPKGITEIADEAFAGCKELSHVVFEGRIKSIGKLAFSRSALLSVTVNGDGLSLGDGAFGECGALEEVNVLGTLESLGRAVFARCGALKSVSFPTDSAANVTEPFTFAECVSLENAVLPVGTYDIKENAFALCSCLESITVLADSLIITRGAIPAHTVIRAPKIPVSGFADGSWLRACHGFFMMLRDGADIDPETLSDNESYVRTHFRDIISHTFRSEATAALHLELTATYYLEKEVLTRRDAESFIASPLLAKSTELLKALREYLASHPEEQDAPSETSSEPIFKRERTLLERYLGTRHFESQSALVDALLTCSGKDRLRELVVYVTERSMLDKESAMRLFDSFAAQSDVAVRGTLIKYMAEHFGDDGGDDLELL